MTVQQGLPKDTEGDFDIPALDISYDDALPPQLGADDVQEAIDKLKMGAAIPKDGEVLFWKNTTPWSSILASINSLPSDRGAIVMMEAGTYTMDVAANLDKVIFVGMVESPTAFGGTPTTINMVSPFSLLGKVLYLINVVALSQVTIWDGVGPFRLNLMGSAELTRDLTSLVPTIKLGNGGILNASLSQFSLFAGGSDYTVEMDDNSVINFLLTAAAIIGDKSAALKGGAVSATATIAFDSTCIVAGVNGAFGSAFGPGIDSTTSTFKNGNAFFGPYTPTTPSNWSPPPDNIGKALDQLAAIAPTANFKWTKYTKNFTDFNGAAVFSSDSQLFILPGKGVIHAVVINPGNLFGGPGILSVTLSVGISGNFTKYAAPVTVSGGPFGLSAIVGMETFALGTSIRVQAVSTGATLDNLNQGSADVYVLTSDLP